MVTVASCGPGDSEAARRAARATAQSFFSALEEGNAQALSRLAPELPLDRAMVAELRTTLQADATTVEIEDLSLEGNTALASVRLEGGEGSEEGALELLVPLAWEEGRWVVEDSITVQQSYDFVPID